MINRKFIALSGMTSLTVLVSSFNQKVPQLNFQPLSPLYVMYIEVFLSNRYLFHWWNFLNFNAYIRFGPQSSVCPFVIWYVFLCWFFSLLSSNLLFSRTAAAALLSFFCIYFRGTCRHTWSRNRTQTTPRQRFILHFHHPLSGNFYLLAFYSFPQHTY